MTAWDGALDSLGMFEATAALPEQVERAALAAADAGPLPSRERIENVVILGMGGSGVAGSVVTSIAGPFMSVPVVVSRQYALPNFVGDNTLVFAVSFSGNTEETIEAASVAASQGGRMVIVSRGGELTRLGEGWGAAVIPIEDAIPQPRAAIGAVSIPLLVVLERIGLFPGASGWIESAVDQLKRRRDQLIEDGNPAQRLAARIGRTIPIMYGGGGVGRTAADRWKTQMNENTKIPAFSNEVPELCHNEICGWGQHGDLTRQVFTLVNLRHDDEHPQVMRRFDLVAEICDEVVASVEEVRAEGDGNLAQLMDLVLLGDFVSLYLAAREGVDPGPVPVLDDLKVALRS